MSRTTLEIADPILADLKRLQAREDKTLGELVTELLSEALAHRRAKKPPAAPRLRWQAADLGARVDVDDKEALWAALDAQDGGAK